MKVRGCENKAQEDALAMEEPLEIRLLYEENGRRAEKSISITMRTPGSDFELAAGFLYGEGIIQSASEIQHISYCAKTTKKEETYNVVTVELSTLASFDPQKLLRHFYTSSSCGVCGKASLEALEIRGCPVISQDHPIVSSGVICSLPETLKKSQSIFEKTGGLHAAALFDPLGKMIGLKEDVGRHNAVDKLIGEQLMSRTVPLSDCLLMVSGRSSFEIVQKALAAGIPIVAAVGAPSSLAVDTARNFGMTLIGFLRGDSFNIYSSPERVRCSPRQAP